MLRIRLLPYFSPKSFTFHYKHDEVTAGFVAHVGSPSFRSYLRLLRAGGAHLDPQPASANGSLSFSQPRVGTHPSAVVVSPHNATGSPCDAVVWLNQGPLTAVRA